MGDRLGSDRITQYLHLRLQETSKPEEVTETRAELQARVQSLRKEVDWGAAKGEMPVTDRKSETWDQGARDVEEEEKAK